MDIPSYAALLRAEWTASQERNQRNEPVVLDGKTLSIPEVIRVCLYNSPPSLTTDTGILTSIQASVDVLAAEIRAGHTIYGVNTGFGGSADTRTDRAGELQIALKQHLQVGVLLPSDKGLPTPSKGSRATTFLPSHALPVPIVRGMMLIRCNSLLRGHSGVRVDVIRAICALLEKGMTPVVPLRGSISASGDLCPLSYIAGVLEGNPDIYVRIDKGFDGENAIYLPADEALKTADLPPIPLQAKEGLGITNGTATSCAAACLAIHQTNQFALLTQLLTAFGTEALLGSAENYHAFISAARPHKGQSEVAANILSFLAGSKLSPPEREEGKDTGLAQDRYALRTAPQWIGPYIEDLHLSMTQITTELNSTTDNPLINTTTQTIHHGGNFQATSLTTAMEKTLLATQSLGKLLHAQCAELLNPFLSKNLPPNLSSDDPSLSFTFKGLDVNMASYMAELAYLAHPISAHVQSAEMDNQAVNSLALIAGRYVLEAGDVIGMMCATYLYALCQAVDLRCLELEFESTVRSDLVDIIRCSFDELMNPGAGVDGFSRQICDGVLERWKTHSHLDLQDRGMRTAEESVGDVMNYFTSHALALREGTRMDLLGAMAEFQCSTAFRLAKRYGSVRSGFFASPTTRKYLSTATRSLYDFVRTDLGVPMHRGLIDHPTFWEGVEAGNEKRVIGSYVSEIYLAIRDGRVHGKVVGQL